MSNGLSSWYDMLRASPGTLYTPTKLVKVERKFSRTIVEDEESEEEMEDVGEIEDKEEEEEEHEVVGEDNIVIYMKKWIDKVTREETFDAMGGVDPSPLNPRKLVRTDPYHGFSWASRNDWDHTWNGETDKQGKFTGEGVVSFSDGGEISGLWKSGWREKRCSTVCPDKGIVQLIGDYKNNYLVGKGKIVKLGEITVEGCFRNGCLHGLAKEMNDEGELTWVGRYESGQAIGVCWRFLKGGGCVMGEVNWEGKLTGENMTYIYPDLYTCLVGSFEDGNMVSAQSAILTGVVLRNGVMHVTTSEPSEEEFKLEISTRTTSGSSPFLRDPYETRMIVCGSSGMTGAGDGLFMKRSVPSETVVSFYNGVRIPASEGEEEEDDWEECSYRIFVGEDGDERMDIPVNLRDINNYCASLAHKTNHAFKPNCRFGHIQHPRFGFIPTIVTTEDVEKGQELFVYYRYLLSDCPTWYSDLWDKMAEPVPLPKLMGQA